MVELVPRYPWNPELDWRRNLMISMFLLALGVVLLSLSAVAAVLTGLLALMLYVGIWSAMLHLVAWIYLRGAVDVTAASHAAFRASLLVFAVSVATFPWTLPGQLGLPVLYFFPLWPYAPSVYAGVVACHGFIALGLGQQIRDARARTFISTAGYLLLLMGPLAMVTQALLFANSSALLAPALILVPVSLTYLLFFAGAFMEYRAYMPPGSRATQMSSPAAV